jgi:hypothetical protein
VVTHFVKAGVFSPDEYVMQPGKGGKGGKGDKKRLEKAKDEAETDMAKVVFASSVARYVFKNNRKTIPPQQALASVGLLPTDTDEAELAKIERLRVKGLAAGRLEVGWEAVRDLFEPGPTALGWYNSVY